ILHDAPVEWSLRARRECAGAQVLLDDGLARLFHESGARPSGFQEAADAARVAFARFDAFVATELLPKAADTCACGAEQQDLLTFPDRPVRYVEQPTWVRAAAPSFYFLPYRSPAPFDHAPVVDYFVPPTADDSAVKLNHVVHHGSLGHHVQNWHAARAAS